VYQIFHTQSFRVINTSPAETITGDSILDNVFELKDTPSWGLFGALIGYVIMFRMTHYFLFAIQTGSLFGGGSSLESQDVIRPGLEESDKGHRQQQADDAA
jgi:hypothetical protein